MANTGAKAPGKFNVGRFVRDVKGEVKKVTWPSRKQIVNNTVVVIIVMVLAAVVVGVIDSAFGYAVRFILNQA